MLSLMAKMSIATSATQNNGVPYDSTAIALTAVSAMEPGKRAARIANAKATSRATASEVPASSKVRGIRALISVKTGWYVRSDFPKSPTTSRWA